MDDELIDYLDNDLVIFALMVIAFYLVLLFLRLLKVYKKTKCPQCSGKLVRKTRTFNDKALAVATLYIFPVRRYKCVHCGWEGPRWNNRKSKKAVTRDDS